MTSSQLRVAIDSDDAGIELKATIVAHLRQHGTDLTDLGYLEKKKADYPEIGYHLAVAIQRKEYDRGILICGTGLGMAIIANKVQGVYAGTCHDVYSAERLQKSNHAQVLTMGARVIGAELAKMVVDAWLGSEFQGGGSSAKVQMIRTLEAESFQKKG